MQHRADKDDRTLNRNLALALALAIPAVLVAAALWPRGDDRPAPGGEALAESPLRGTVPVAADPNGQCLADSVDEETRAELIAESVALAAESEYADQSHAPVPLTVAEAESYLEIAPRFPETPEGWTTEVTLMGGLDPVHDQCWLYIKVTDPTGGEEIVFPEHSVQTRTGETVVVPEKRVFLSESARLTIQRKRINKVSFGTEKKNVEIAINGQSAVLYEKPRERSVTIGWFEGKSYLVLSCSVVPRDQCIEIAESVK